MSDLHLTVEEFSQKTVDQLSQTKIDSPQFSELKTMVMQGMKIHQFSKNLQASDARSCNCFFSKPVEERKDEIITIFRKTAQEGFPK